MKIRIKTKLWLGLGFLMLVILAMGLVSSYYLYKANSAAEMIIKDNYESVVHAKQMIAALDALQEEMTEKLPAKTAREAFLKEFREQLSRQEQNITEVGEDQVTEKIKQGLQQLRLSLPQAGPGNQPVVQEDIATTRESLHQLLDLNLQAILRKNNEAKATARQAVIYVGLIGVLCFLTAFTFLVNFPGYIANPIRELTESIREIAARNYSKRLHFKSNDEFGELAESFNKMARKLDEYEHSNLSRILFEKKRIETIITHMHDAIIGLDNEKKILFANPVACQLLNTEEKHLTGKYAPDVAALNDLMRLLIRDVMHGEGKGKEGKQGQDDTNPIKIVIEGKESWFSKEILHVKTKDESASGKQVSIGHVIILKNITSFRELDIAKTNFIATVSHELKTPIASIKMSSKLLEDSRVGPVNEEQKQLLDTIKDETGRLLRITGELLNMAQLETGNINLEVRPVHPGDIARYAIDSMKFQAKQKKISIVSHIREGLREIQADPEKTAWVLVNLISNAIRYSSEKAEITLEVYQQKNEIIFSVRDSGPGIEKQYQPRLFEKFYKTPGSGKGTGLGLAISKDFIEAQGGKIGVESELGEGSLFYFSLPATWDPARKNPGHAGQK